MSVSTLRLKWSQQMARIAINWFTTNLSKNNMDLNKKHLYCECKIRQSIIQSVRHKMIKFSHFNQRKQLIKPNETNHYSGWNCIVGTYHLFIYTVRSTDITSQRKTMTQLYEWIRFQVLCVTSQPLIASIGRTVTNEIRFGLRGITYISSDDWPITDSY